MVTSNQALYWSQKMTNINFKTISLITKEWINTNKFSLRLNKATDVSYLLNFIDISKKILQQRLLTILTNQIHFHLAWYCLKLPH